MRRNKNTAMKTKEEFIKIVNSMTLSHVCCLYAKYLNPIESINKTNQNYRKYISLEKKMRQSIIEEAKFEAKPTFEARLKICLEPTLSPKLGPGQL